MTLDNRYAVTAYCLLPATLLEKEVGKWLHSLSNLG